MYLKYLRFGVLIVCLAFGSLLAACGPAAQRELTPSDREGPAAAGAQKDEQPKYGGILRQVNGNAGPSWDIISEGTVGTRHPIQPIYNQLVQYDPLDHNGIPNKIIPDLAQRWEISNDGLTYTFDLRKGVKFHDGVEFTSEDAKFSFERHANPPKGVPSLRIGWYRDLFERIETPDQYTLRLLLKEPNAALLKTIASAYTPMVPRHLLDGKGRISTIDMVVGTGPFKLVKADRNVGYSMVKNADYYLEDRPYLDGLEYTVVVEESGRAAAVRVNAVDCICAVGLSDPSFDSLVKTLGNKVKYRTDLPGLSFSSIQMNNKAKPFDDPRVRKAISMGLDRPTVVRIAADGSGSMGAFMPPNGDWGISSEDMAKRPGFHSPTPQDIQEAKKLLADAGYPNGFDIVSNNGYGDTQDRTNQLLIEMLKPMGIKLTIRQLERTSYYAALDNRDFQMAPMGHAHVLDDPNDHIATYYITEGGRNYSQFSDPKVDAMYKEQSRTMDPEKRKKIVRELQEYMLEQMPFIVVSWSDQRRDLWYPYVKGYNPTSVYTAFRRETVWLDK